MANPAGSTSGVRAAGLGSSSANSPGAGLRRRIICVVAAAAAGGLGIAACSKTQTPTVATVVARDNSICSSYAQRIAKIATPVFEPAKATGKDLPAAAHYLDQVVPLMRAEQREIKSTGEPDGANDLYASTLDALAAVIRDEQAARKAAHAGDLNAFRTAYRADTADVIRLSGVAQQFGLTACVQG